MSPATSESLLVCFSVIKAENGSFGKYQGQHLSVGDSSNEGRVGARCGGSGSDGLESAGGNHRTARFACGSEQPEFDTVRGSYAVPQECAGGLGPAVSRFTGC